MPRGGQVIYWVFIYIYIYLSGYDVVFKLKVMLRSTTGPYGWPMYRSHMGRCFSLHRDRMGDEVQEEWLGCWHDASPMFDIPESTPVWAQHILFFDFQHIKTYIYIIFSKPIHSIKKHWYSLTLSWPDKVQRVFSIAHELSK